jgi:hypothetical protein
MAIKENNFEGREGARQVEQERGIGGIGVCVRGAGGKAGSRPTGMMVLRAGKETPRLVNLKLLNLTSHQKNTLQRNCKKKYSEGAGKVARV